MTIYVLLAGVTTVEWTTILNDLKARYKEPAFCLTSSVAVLINKEFLGGDKELRNLIESKFIYNLCLDYPKESIAEFANFIRGSGVRALQQPNSSSNSSDTNNCIKIH